VDLTLAKKQKGMTIAELLVVISIITVLALISIWFFRTQILKGNDAKRKGDINHIQKAVEEYETDNDCYPLPQTVICNPGTGLKPYLSKIPCDPTTGASYYYDHEDSECPTWYRIFASLENKVDGDIAKVGCANGCGPGTAFNYYASSPNAPTPETGSGTGTGSGGAPPATNFYGCFGESCLPISWDPIRPGPECDPNYQSPDCYNQCGMPETQCQAWQ